MDALDSGQLNFTDIPNEICEHIFKTRVLDHTDLWGLSETCKYFHQICNSNNLWKHKLQQRFPDFENQYDHNVKTCWREVYRWRLLLGRQTRQLVSQLSSKYFHLQEISREAFAPFALLQEQHPKADKFIIGELLEILHDGFRYKNLTTKYYTEKVLRHICQTHLQKEWFKFLQQPEEQQSFERGAVLIAQWCQPAKSIKHEDVARQLDHIAELTRIELSHRYPDHPVLHMHNNGEKHHASSHQCRAILETLNVILFERLGFRGNEEMYYDPCNSYINKVLETKKGIPITLAVLYSSIAKRLGVTCEPVNFPSHFLLRWLEHPLSPFSQQYVYIDVFRGGKFYLHEECCTALGIPETLGFMQENYMSVSTKKVLERMARNLVNIGRHQNQLGDGLLCLRNAIDLFLLISPDDLEMRLLQVRINLHLSINLPDVIDNLQSVADLDPTRMGLVAYLQQEAEIQMRDNADKADERVKIIKKFRRDNTDVKFSVGMVMKHKRYKYTCVIFGWDNTCQASEEWIIQMGVHNLQHKHKQPFYNVLVEDGSNRYAAQENMLYTDTPREITHPEVGRYFQTFTGISYIPNPEKQEEYPDDGEVTNVLLQEYYGEGHPTNPV